MITALAPRDIASAPGTPRWAARVLRMNRLLNTGLRHLAGGMLALMMLVVFLQIIVRFLLPKLGLNVSVPWSEELARYLMIWCIFIGAAVASRAADLIAVESLVDALPTRLGWRMKALSYLATIAFLVMLIWLGWRWVEFGAGESSTVMDLPMSQVYLAMPIGAALMIANILTRLLEAQLRRREVAAC